jgi:Tol biopolymer transport system component
MSIDKHGRDGEVSMFRAVRIVAIMSIAAVIVSIATMAADARFTAWEAVINIEAVPGTSSELNTPYTDGCPIQSPDGLSLYMASNRPGGVGSLDIWVAHRTARDAPFGAPVNLGAPVNSSADDFCPTPVPGKRLFFVSARAGGCGGTDIYVTRRNPHGGWRQPTNLGCEVNSAAGEASPSLVDQDDAAILYFSSNRPGGFAPESGSPPDSDIYASVLESSGIFGTAALVPGLNTAAEDARPNVRKDGLEIVFDSTRPSTLGGPDIYSATRASVEASWWTPVNLGPAVNTPSSESRASLSRDARTLVFGSNRPGSELGPDGVTPSNDIYVSTRTRSRGA